MFLIITGSSSVSKRLAFSTIVSFDSFIAIYLKCKSILRFQNPEPCIPDFIILYNSYKYETVFFKNLIEAFGSGAVVAVRAIDGLAAVEISTNSLQEKEEIPCPSNSWKVQ
jgi:hypothetical protein